MRALARILQVLSLAQRVYERVGYRGPVRARYYLRAPEPVIFDRNPRGINFRPPTAPAGRYTGGPVDGYLSRGSLEPIAKELLDPIFHAIGKSTAPYFNADGRLTDPARKQLGAALARLLP